MSLVSTGFLLFLLAGVIVYYIIPKKMQWVWLLVLSCFYYLCSGYKTIIFIITTTIVTYFAGVFLNKENERIKNIPAQADRSEKKKIKEDVKRRKKLIVALLLVIIFGILAVIKYHTFAIENINAVIGVFTGKYDTIPTFKLLLPLGISFYTFQSAGYIIDVYRDKYECCNNIFKFALFVSFFPQIMQGPIGRYDRLSPQFNEPHYFSLENTEYGLQLMLWGFFKKIVIADRIGVVADKVFLHPYDYNGIFVIVGVLAYCLQLYADFSGGMDVVSGAAELYGIRLDKNFRQPFFLKSISEFWRRWLITLGTWMKDYVFYPFSLSKKMMKFSKFMKKHLGTFAGKTLPICLADLLIFFLVGVWHGAAWKFIVYGMYNGIIIAASSLLEPVYEKMFKVTHINKNAKWYRVFQIIRTFILVNIGWFFDDAANLKESFVLIKNVFVNFSIKPLFDGSVRAMMEFSSMDMLAIAVGIAALFIVGVINEKGIDIRKSLAKKPLILRWAVYLMLVMSIPVLGYVSAETGGFLYAQF